MSEWRSFAHEGRYWCIRAWERGYETWYGSEGKGGRCTAKVAPPASLDKQVRAKQKKGYQETTRLPERRLKPVQIARARAEAEREVDDRFRGSRKVENALWSGDAKRLRTLFEKGKAGVDVCRWDEDEQNADPLLNSAVFCDSPALLGVFLECGAPPDGWGDDPPLASAAAMGKLATAKVLLDAGADPNRSGRHKKSPLTSCGHFGGAPMARLLIEHGADPNLRDVAGETPLSSAISAGMGNLPLVRALLEAGADPNQPGADGAPLIEICRNRKRTVGGAYAEIQEALEGAGAALPARASEVNELLDLLERLDTDTRRRHCESLSTAAARGDVELVRRFLADGEDPDKDHRDGWYPIQRAAHFGHRAVVDLLREHGAKEREMPPATSNPIGEKVGAAVAMVMASIPGFGGTPDEAGRLEGEERTRAELRCAELIQSAAVAPHMRKLRVHEKPLLSYAATHGLACVARALVEQGVDLEAAPNALEAAVMNGRLESVEVLLEAGAEREGDPGSNRTPLLWAASHGDLTMVKTLVSAGADVHAKDTLGLTCCTRVEGPEAHATRRYLRSLFAEEIETCRRHSTRFKKRNHMYDEPEQRVGLGAYRSYHPDVRIGLVRAELSAIQHALSSRYEYEANVMKRALLGVDKGAFLFHMVGKPWSVVAPIGLYAADLHELMVETAESLGTAAATCDVARDELQVIGSTGISGPDAIHGWFEEQALWIPPHYAEGDGIYDHGIENRLIFNGVDRAFIERVDRVILLR